MAKIAEMDTEALAEWLESRPAVIRKMVESHPPDRLYRMSDTRYRVTIYSYAEDGTVTVIVSGEYNAVIFPRRVFGVAIDTLTECDLPGPGKPLGCLVEEPDEEMLEAIRQRLGIGALLPSKDEV